MMLSIRIGQQYRFTLGSQHAQVQLTGDGCLIVHTDCRPGIMGISRPNSGYEFKTMKDFIDDRWRSVAVAERIEPGGKVLLDMGGERLAVEVIDIIGKDVCIRLGIDQRELEPGSVESRRC